MQHVAWRELPSTQYSSCLRIWTALLLHTTCQGRSKSRPVGRLQVEGFTGRMDRGGLAGQQGMFVSIVIAVMGAVLLTLILRLVSGGRIREM